MSENWDLVVVGAGPADASAASAALAALQRRPEARVLLLDRDDFPRDKSCGDAVAPHTTDLLDELGTGGVLADRSPTRDLALSTADGVMAQRTIRDQGVFDWYVDLGLGDGVVRPGQAAAAAGRLLASAGRR